MTTHIRVVDGVRFTCPFCGGAVEAGTLSDGQFGCIHDAPPCARFEGLEPDEFLRECRLKMSPETLS